MRTILTTIAMVVTLSTASLADEPAPTPTAFQGVESAIGGLVTVFRAFSEVGGAISDTVRPTADLQGVRELTLRGGSGLGPDARLVAGNVDSPSRFVAQR